jgi:hypothetical protein
MEELFGNLIYLIPVALVVFRVLSAITGSKKKRQEQKEAQNRETQQSGPRTPVRRPVETTDPVMRELSKQFGISPESAGTEKTTRQTEAARNTVRQPVSVPRSGLPHWEREKKPVPQKKKPPVCPVSALPAVEFTSTSGQAGPLSPADSGGTKSAANTGAAGQSAPVFAALNLRQGFVWAELLGQPRAMNPFQ